MVDTIFAQATARGRAGIAVVRISGPEAFAATVGLAGGVPEPRRASVRWLSDPASGERLDQAVVLAFVGPASFTGEDVVELHVHGSPAVTAGVLGALGRMPGLRSAEPGEFTRRALLNGRLDLAQVEGLADLVAAETAAQRRQALALMQRKLSSLAAAWGRALLQALAFVEATIDFADEELPPGVLDSVRDLLEQVFAAMQHELRGSPIAERIREGFEVALVGPPNVGKSTLLNALAGREAALTSELAGTTRDVIEVRMDLGGLPLTLLDMAGLRDPGDPVEAMGVDRARARAGRAEMRVFLVDREGEADCLGVERQPGDPVVLSKADLRPGVAVPAVSGTTGEGIDNLLEQVGKVLEPRAAMAGTATNARQREAIGRAAEAVRAALAQLTHVAPHTELVAEEIRGALRALDFLVGRVDVEAVLDVIFQSFCLGK